MRDHIRNEFFLKKLKYLNNNIHNVMVLINFFSLNSKKALVNDKSAPLPSYLKEILET